ncbi:MAG: hypothetical protein ACI8WT_003656 [Clostridium sp.]|jgi:hypothetical protein
MLTLFDTCCIVKAIEYEGCLDEKILLKYLKRDNRINRN